MCESLAMCTIASRNTIDSAMPSSGTGEEAKFLCRFGMNIFVLEDEIDKQIEVGVFFLFPDAVSLIFYFLYPYVCPIYSSLYFSVY